jgi:hypothetical protein
MIIEVPPPAGTKRAARPEMVTIKRLFRIIEGAALWF